MIWSYSQALAARLMGWSVLSVAAGAGLVLAGDAFWQALGVQAVVWGVIDGVIAWAGAREARRRGRPAAAQAARLRRLLWLNAGLDVGYLAVGGWLILGPGAAAPAVAGHGWGVVVQGAFLLVFDAAHAWAIPGEARLPGDRFFQGPEHQPFHLAAAPDRAAVLVHGFPGTPAEMRAVGECLHAAGWTVQAVLLPGFGPEIPTLIDRRYSEWVGAVVEAVTALRRTHGRVLLVGYSFGGALAVEAAASAAPAGLVLLAPFTLAPPLWQRIALTVLAPLLPHAFRPYARADFDDPRFRHTMEKFMGGADLDDPALRQAVRGLAVPVTVMQEIGETRRALTYAQAVRAPVLVVQGEHDVVSRPALTDRLVARFSPPPREVRVPAGHELIEATAPAWPQVAAAIQAFAAEL